MKHATADTLRRIENLLEAMRALGVLREPRPGCFYLKSSAFAHFHDDEDGIFVDVKLDPPGFSRLPASTDAEQAEVLHAITRALGGHHRHR